MPETTTTQPSPADLRQRAAIARGRERRRSDLLPLRTEVAEAIAAVGWQRARPVIESVLGTVPVTGPHGAWWAKVGKRAGAAILAAWWPFLPSHDKGRSHWSRHSDAL